MFKLDDNVWVAFCEIERQEITCPDCLGSGQLTVIMGDGSHVSIDCTGCQQGYNAPTGRISENKFISKVYPATIDKIEMSKTKVIYQVGSYLYDSERVFATREEAEQKAKQLSAARTKEEMERINQKEKPTRSWAWNATYHRGEIRKLQKQLEYHTAKLNVAKIKAKNSLDNSPEL